MRRLHQNLKRQNQKGFTLIEIIVATALFVVVISAIIGIYIDTLRINRRADAIRLASQNVLYISEFMSKEIRNGQIDYFGPVPSPCGALPTSGSSLAVLNIDGDHECFYLSGTNLLMAKSAGGTLLNPVQLNDSNVKILGLNFQIAPACNPYTAGTATEPQVTITAQIKTNSDQNNVITLPLDTTISIPKYDINASGAC